MESDLKCLEGQIDEAKREMTGYLNLPPSCDLARVEVAKAEKELRNLMEQVNYNISSLHL